MAADNTNVKYEFKFPPVNPSFFPGNGFGFPTPRQTFQVLKRSEKVLTDDLLNFAAGETKAPEESMNIQVNAIIVALDLIGIVEKFYIQNIPGEFQRDVFISFKGHNQVFSSGQLRKPTQREIDDYTSSPDFYSQIPMILL